MHYMDFLFLECGDHEKQINYIYISCRPEIFCRKPAEKS